MFPHIKYEQRVWRRCTGLVPAECNGKYTYQLMAPLTHSHHLASRSTLQLAHIKYLRWHESWIYFSTHMFSFCPEIYEI